MFQLVKPLTMFMFTKPTSSLGLTNRVTVDSLVLLHFPYNFPLVL